MELSRRDLLKAIACAFATAAIPCTIPDNVFAEPEMPKVVDPIRQLTVWAAHKSGNDHRFDQIFAYAFPPQPGVSFCKGDLCRINSNGYLDHCETPDQFEYVALTGIQEMWCSHGA